MIDRVIVSTVIPLYLGWHWPALLRAARSWEISTQLPSTNWFEYVRKFSLAWMRDEYAHFKIILLAYRLPELSFFFFWGISCFAHKWAYHHCHWDENYMIYNNCFPYILGDIPTRQKHKFCWWRDRLRQSLLRDICMSTLMIQKQNEWKM